MGNRRRNGRTGLYRVHRVLGLSSALFVLLLAVTGLALNHTGLLALDRHHVAADWLLDWYGIEPPEVTGFAAGDHHVAHMGERLWLDGEPVLEDVDALRGAVKPGRFLVVALGNELALLTVGGRLVERIGAEAGAPREIRRVGARDDGTVVVEAADGYFRSDPTLAGWQPTTGPAVDWSRPAPLPAELKNRMARQWRGRGLSVERLLLDLHSGRILGRFGVWLMDAMALIFIVLAITGTWVWYRRRPVQRNRGSNKPN